MAGRDSNVAAAWSGRSEALEPWVLRRSLWVLLFGGAAALGAFVVAYRFTDGTDKDRFDVAIKAATAIAAFAAGLLTWARLELSRREHHLAAEDRRLAADRDLTERYSRSIDQLGSGDPLVQVGGIFALERFALDAERAATDRDIDWRMALDVLAALTRKLSRESERVAEARPTGGDQPGHTAPEPPIAVIEAVRVLGRFDRRAGRSPTSPPNYVCVEHDMSGVLLTNAKLAGASFPSVDFTGADLSGATLTGADLTDAVLAPASPAPVSRAPVYEAGWSSLRLAEKFSVTPHTVLSALRQVGVRIRPGKGGPQRHS